MMEDSSETLSVEEFLRSRNIPANIIQKFIDEKIDIPAIKAMSDTELKEYLPAHGDRIAIKSFSSKMRRTSLIEKLRKSIQEHSQNNQKNEDAQKQRKAVLAGKDSRIIEVAWRQYCPKTKCFKKVRGPIGGNRRISVLKKCKADEIKNKAIHLFFPDGESVYGHINEFESELLDYKSHKIEQDLDINEMYSRTGMTTLRFYLSTTKKQKDKEEEFKPHSNVNVPNLLMDLRPKHHANANSVGDDIDKMLNEYLFEEQSKNTTLKKFYEAFSDGDDDLPRAETQKPNEVLFDETQFYKPEGVPNTVILHRGNVFDELINHIKVHSAQSFKTIQVEMVLPNGSSERAEDLGGVLRDALTEFWETFYSKCTLGIEYKVPVLRHDLQKEEWSAIGTICAEGFLAVGYFPIKLAPTFVKYCLQEVSDEEEIFNDFLKYISVAEAKLLEAAIKDFNDVDQDELIDFFSQYNSKWLPNEKNIKTLIKQIATEELIQKPSFVKECFFPKFYKVRHSLSIKEIYTKLEPTSKNIINTFDVSHVFLDPPKMEIYRYLTKFIKTADENIRSAFMRFCTGSNLVLGEKIKIDFIESDGFQRSPIAHTCTGLLQIPLSYEDFVSFRQEFTQLLSSSIWVMDII